MIRCVKCKRAVLATDKFCPECGAYVGTATKPSDRPDGGTAETQTEYLGIDRSGKTL